MNQNQWVSYPNVWQYVYELSKWSDILCSSYRRAHNGLNGWPRSLILLPRINRLLSNTTYLCSFRVIGQKQKSVSNPQCFTEKVPKVTLTFNSDQKSIGFLLSWWWTYVWSLKVIGQKYKSVSRLQGKVLRNHALTHSRTYLPNHTWTAALIYPLQRFYEGKMSWVIIFYFSKNFFSNNLMF